MDNLFADFTTDAGEEVGGRNEAGEALEERGREEEGESTGREGMDMDEFLVH